MGQSWPPSCQHHGSTDLDPEPDCRKAQPSSCLFLWDASQNFSDRLRRGAETAAQKM